MKRRDIVDLLLLAALWGASFLFMRIAAPAFGPIPMIELRVGIAALVLLPVMALGGGLATLWRHFVPLAFVGLTNSALPFVLYAWAMLSVSGGFASIVNATSPLWAALVAFVWFRDRLSGAAIGGMVLGLLGVVVLAWDKATFSAGGSGWAILACLGATLSYGIAANFTKRFLTGVPALAIATGSQFFAALMLLPAAIAMWPEGEIASTAWTAVILLAIGSTALAYFLYFRLIGSVGPAKAIAVTFLIPAFGMFWGWAVLNEPVTASMLLGCAVILIGTALSTGAIRIPGWMLALSGRK